MTYIELGAAEPLLTPGEAAALYRVDTATLARWADAGKLTAVRTLGRHRRYREAEVRDLIGGGSTDLRHPRPPRPSGPDGAL